MLTVAVPKRNKLQNIIALTPKDGESSKRVKNECKMLLLSVRLVDMYKNSD